MMQSFDDRTLDQPFKRQLFDKVRAVLQRGFRKSRKGQDIIFAQESHRTTSEVLDGRGGASFLLELLHYLGGSCLTKRELLKKILVIAARSLKIPVMIMPSGAASVCMYPHFEEPPVARLLQRTLRRGFHALPSEAEALIFQYAAPVWVAQQSMQRRNLSSRPQTFLIEAGESRTNRFLSSVFPFESSLLRFSDGRRASLEWASSEDPHTALFVRTEDIWALINFCRYYRKRNSSYALKVRGLGILLV